MNRPSDIFMRVTGKTGLYNIMPFRNISSVLSLGILSNFLAEKLPHVSVAMNEVQSRRDKVNVPNGMPLHQYANLYFDARNPMMYKRQDEDICVLKISPRVLDLENVVISDRNASSDYASFHEPTKILDKLDYDMIYAKSWVDANYYLMLKKKSVKCAEVLIPEKILPQYIIGAAVKNQEDKERLEGMGFNKKIYIEKELFFK